MSSALCKNIALSRMLSSAAPQAHRAVLSQLAASGPRKMHSLLGAHSKTPVAVVVVKQYLFRRWLHSSPLAMKKGTQAKRTIRLADATGANPNSAEFEQVQEQLRQKIEEQRQEQIKRANEIPEITLFEIDRKKLFIFATGAVIVIFLLFCGTAEFMWNWYATYDEVTGEFVPAPVSTRLGYTTFFVGVGVFLLFTRWFWGSRFINKLDLLPGNKFRMSTYTFWGGNKSVVYDITDIKPNHVNISPAYYTFKMEGNRLYHMIDRQGRSLHEEHLLNLLHGRPPVISK